MTPLSELGSHSEQLHPGVITGGRVYNLLWQNVQWEHSSTSHSYPPTSHPHPTHIFVSGDRGSNNFVVLHKLTSSFFGVIYGASFLWQTLFDVLSPIIDNINQELTWLALLPNENSSLDIVWSCFEALLVNYKIGLVC